MTTSADVTRTPLRLSAWADFTQPSELARWVLAHGTGPVGWLPSGTGAGIVQFHFMQAIKQMRKRDFPEEDVLRGWLRVFAAAPDQESQTYLRALLTGRVLPRRVPDDEVAAWIALGEAGPVAFVAGLTPDEMTERLAAGTLIEDGLAALIALRGWVLPPVSVSGGY